MCCREINARGEPCGMTPLEGKDVCWAHDPENRRQAAAARRKGGYNRRVPKVSAGDADPLRSVEAILSVLERAVADTQVLENSVQRNRTLAYLATAALNALEKAEMEQRIAALEQAANVQRG